MIPLPEDVRARLAARLTSEGDWSLSRRTGVHRASLLRAVAGLRVQRRIASAIRCSLGAA
jgi:hypothetical protein